MDQDLWLKSLHFHGKILLQTILGEELDSQNEAEMEKIIMCRFIKKRLNILFKFSDPIPNALPEYTIPVIPIELFQNASAEDRRDLFYKSLDRGHILILQVINDTLPDNYKLLVLCKEENYMKLNDLSIVMYLPKLPAELELVRGKLESSDLIRAAVCSCSINERKLYVTLHKTILEDEYENVKLGKITEKDLPFYIGDVDVGPSYIDYLQHKTNSFNNPDWAEELHTVLNIDKNYLYSFMENMDGKTYAPVVYAEELRKKQILTVTTAQCTKAQEFYENGSFTEAFMCLNKALSIDARNVDALVSRGTLYANTNNLRKAFVDMEKALKIDSNHEGARKQMSILLTSCARLHIDQKNFCKAKDALDAALDVDSENKDAIAALEEVKKLNFSITLNNKAEASSSEKKDFMNSSSSDISDCSSIIKEDLKAKQDSFLEASTKAFLSSIKKKRYQGNEKSKRRSKKKHHRHHKSRSKSPKKKTDSL